MRLQQADRHVVARLLLDTTLQEHAVGLADPGRHPDEDLQATAAILDECGHGSAVEIAP
jgi:hypothetical protein